MKKGDRIFYIVILAVALIFLAGAFTIIPIGELTVTAPGGYPVFVACLCLVFGIWVFLENRSRPAKAADETPAETPEEAPIQGVFNQDVLVLIGLMALYFVAMIFLHYTIATLLFVFCAIYYLESKNWKLSFLVSFISTFMILLVFKYLFNVILP